MSESAERRWGVMAMHKDFHRALLELHLPVGHKIIAYHIEPTASFDEYLIEGPDMPVVRDKPERVGILFYVDESGLEYGYWSHKQEKRWVISAVPALAGD